MCMQIISNSEEVGKRENYEDCGEEREKTLFPIHGNDKVPWTWKAEKIFQNFINFFIPGFLVSP